MIDQSMFMHCRARLCRAAVSSQSGLSLVELLIGMVVALITTLAIMETYRGFEGQKRTTSASSEAQSNGQFAYYQLEREFRTSGYGLAGGADLLGCDFSSGGYDTLMAPTGWMLTAPAGMNRPLMAPVLIAEGGAAPDGIRVMRASSGNPIAYSGTGALTQFNVDTARSNVAFLIHRADLVLQTGGGQCRLAQVTNEPDLNNLSQVTFVPGAGTCRRSSCGASTFNLAAAMPGASALSHIGTLTVSSYTIANNALNVNTATVGAGYDAAGNQLTAPPWIATTGGRAEQMQIAEQIVDMQAQYGIDTTVNDKTDVTNWVDATGAYSAATLTLTQVRQIRAIRFAIVARNNLRERKNSSNACDATTTTAYPNSVTAVAFPNGTSLNVNLARGAASTDGPNDWRCYRYRIFSGVVPLRNTIWNTRDYE